jgi:hypothetical protein
MDRRVRARDLVADRFLFGLVVRGGEGGERGARCDGGGRIVALAARAVEEVLERGHGRRHRLFETGTRTARIRAEGGEPFAQRVGARRAFDDMARVIRAEVGDEAVSQVAEVDRFHSGEPLGAERPPGSVPGGRRLRASHSGDRSRSI